MPLAIGLLVGSLTKPDPCTREARLTSGLTTPLLHELGAYQFYFLFSEFIQ